MNDLEQARIELLEPIDFKELGQAATRAVSALVSASQSLALRFNALGCVDFIAGSLETEALDYTPEDWADDDVQHDLVEREPTFLVRPAAEPDFRRGFEASRVFHEFYSRRDMHHLAALWPTPHRYTQPGMMGLLFTRSKRQGEFDSTHCRALLHLEKDLRAAWRRCERATQLDLLRSVLTDVVSENRLEITLLLTYDGREAWVPPHVAHLWAARSSRALREALRYACRAHGFLHTWPFKRTTQLSASNAQIKGDLAGIPCIAEIAVRRAPEVWWVRLTVDVQRRLQAQYGLTRAEVTVARLLARGLSNAAIAGELCISMPTVKTHVTRVMGKLGLPSRAHVPAVYASLSTFEEHESSMRSLSS